MTVEKACKEEEDVSVPPERFNWLLSANLLALNFGAALGIWFVLSGQVKLATFILSKIHDKI